MEYDGEGPLSPWHTYWGYEKGTGLGSEAAAIVYLADVILTQMDQTNTLLKEIVEKLNANKPVPEPDSDQKQIHN
jgi:hypothetical protein